MVNYYIYAKDFSQSTDCVNYYHTNGMKTLEQFKSDVERIKKQDGNSQTESKIIYLHWGDTCYEVNEETTIKTYIEHLGEGMGTQPDTIIQWIKQNYNICGEDNRIKLLYIITDGAIYGGAEECFNLNKDVHYENVVFHALNQNLDDIDMSVAASFFKNRCMVYRNNELIDNVDISQEFDYDNITLDNFASEKENLRSYIKVKFIGQCKHDILALKETDKLKKLRNKLFDELTSESEVRKVNLETKDKEVFLQEFVRTIWYMSLNAEGNDVKVDIEKFISTLINYIVSDKKSFAFDALKFETKFATLVVEEPIVEVNFPPEQEIEFPDIILDDDKGIPVVILTECNLLDKLIFHGKMASEQVEPASFRKFKSAMECPLFLTNDPDVSESIGYFYTLNAYKQLLENGINTEPRTRRPFHGGLVLTDTDLFDKYNDYVLSATYFNSKKVKFNLGLFYFVLWKNCNNKEWMDQNVKKQFQKYVMRRISTTVCKIGLSSLPLDPQEIVSLPTALWYCAELSSCIFKDDPQNFMHERLRMFYGVAHLMVEILKYFDYPLDCTSFDKRCELIRYVMILKKIPTRKEKVFYLLERIFKKVNGLLVSEIQNPLNLNKLNYLKYCHKTMLSEDLFEEKVNLNDYVHLMHSVSKLKVGQDAIPICMKTYRPFFTIEKNKSFYTELIEARRKVVINNADDKNRISITYEPLDSLEFDKILSVHNLFINCVKDNQKYPTLPEYNEYILKKKKFNGELVTIFPPTVYAEAEDVYSNYQSIMTNVDVQEFLHVVGKYYGRLERIKAEEVVIFNDDCEIEEFISSEELKVGIKKKL